MQDYVLQGLEEGYCTTRELIGYCKGKGVNRESSVYRALNAQQEKWGLVAKLTVESEDEEKRFVVWSPALQQLFYKVNESSSEVGSYLGSSPSRGFSVNVKSQREFTDCTAQVSIVSCHREAEPAEIERFRLDTPSSFNLEQIRSFPLVKVQEGKLLVEQNEFQPSFPVNVILFSLNCRGAFYHVPYFLNLKSGKGPCRILGFDVKESEKPDLLAN